MFVSLKPNKVKYMLCLFLCFFSAYAIISTSSENTVAVNGDIQNVQTADVPILMYHGVSDVKKIQNDYVISPQEFEDDLKALKENGYTSVFISDVISFAENKGSLPEKPIVITFDDGYYNNYLYAYPLLKKYDFKATISPIAYYSDFYSEVDDVSECYSHCTWTQLKEMSESGVVEIGNHTYNLHTLDGDSMGIRKKSSETDAEYKTRLTEDITAAQNRIHDNIEKDCVVFAYPFGACSKDSEQILRKLGFKAILTCASGTNHLSTGDAEALFHLKRIIRPHGNQTALSALNSQKSE